MGIIEYEKGISGSGGVDGTYIRFLKATIWDIHNYKLKTQGLNQISHKSQSLYKSQSYVSSSYLSYFSPLMREKSYNKIPSLYEMNYSGSNRVINILDMKYFNGLMRTKYNSYREKYNIFEYEIERTFLSMIKDIKPLIIISISGGVDSMLLSYVLSRIHYRNPDKFDMCLVHISYMNREECVDEIEFLKYWSREVVNKYLFVREINEIKRERSTKMRSLYENITRDIRYDIYRNVAKKYVNSVAYVCLGHNKDDAYENILTNLSKGIKFDNLYGMKDISRENGVSLMRLFLNTTKAEIYNYSKTLKIPYLQDSTPKWSNRGKLRDVLIPQIDKFNPYIMTGLYQYIGYANKMMKQMERLIDTYLEEAMRNTVKNNESNESNKIRKQNPNIILFGFKDDDIFVMNYDTVQFWVKVWKYICKPKPSNKSILNLIKMIKMNRNRWREMKLKSNKKDEKYSVECMVSKIQKVIITEYNVSIYSLL